MNLKLIIRNKISLKFFSFFIAYCILLPIVVLVVSPLYIYKRIVIFFSKRRKNGFFAPLSVDDCIHVNDDIHGRPRGSICGVICLKNDHSFDELVARVEREAAKRPKLACTITRWMFIYFWKKCDDFQLSNHVSINEESDQDKLTQFVNNLGEKGYPVGKPLWEFISLPNYTHAESGTSSAIAVRAHHILGDGLALIAVIRDLCDKDPAADEEVEKLLKAIRKKMHLNFWKKVSYAFQLIFITPWEVLYWWVSGFSAQSIPRSSKRGRNCDYSGKINVESSIDLALLKRISKKIGANVTSVIHAGVTGAVRRLILDRGGDPTGDIAGIYVLPKLNHPGTMSNNVFGVPLISPMSGEDRFQRIFRISKTFDHVFYSALPIGMIAIYNIFGLLSGFFVQTRLTSNTCTYIHSNIAYFGKPMKMFGNTLERWILAPGLQSNGISLLVLTTSYNGKLGIQLVGDKAVFPDEESLMRVANYIEDEFNSLDA